MAIYEIRSDQIRPIQTATFAELGLRERDDLQRLLREKIEIVAPDCLVIAEEFGHWEDSKRRIDLLAIDRDANLVIIELKRTETGGHMELQALRYAAMVSTMTAEQAIDASRKYLQSIGEDPNTAEQRIIDHLGWDEIDDELFAQDVRIVLVSAEFSKELTTAVIWLNERAMDIRCVRLQPHRDGDRVLVDVQQVVPLPEAEEYQIRVREKQVKERTSRQSSGRDFTRFDVIVNDKVYENLPKRRAILTTVQALCDRGVGADEIKSLINWRSNRLFFEMDGALNAAQIQEAILQDPDAGKLSHALKRFFCHEDEDLIYQSGKTYAFTNQWSGRTEEAMTILIKTYPDSGIRFKHSGAD